ncbi:hypothetical protein ASE75_06025 [Sphingomonas sp. Leaf17]|uniref:hypothetical protein n=1 Tax=Sphingomonas sp. Leaf17 TaxID=1735683 RepID=UPI0006F4F02F|nr:hypothetical protein [Sphingomonas sp. Leaf17]KQM65786.1 hypothetical protein ASE75_06025 [Sphingomonas sp. Leaf17]
MANPASIRLGTTGKEKVKADLNEIADAGVASVKRLQRQEQQAAADRDAAIVREKAARSKLDLLMPGLNPAKLDAGAGVRDTVGKDAASSAQVFEQAYAQMEKRADALRAAIDPVFLAQQRFDREIAEARTLLSHNVISLDDYSKRHWQLQQSMAGSTRELEGQAKASGLAKAGYQQLNYQLSDIATQFSSGAPPMQIFAQQSGQLFQALGMIAAGGASASAGVEQAGAASEEAGVDVAGLGEQAVGVAEKAGEMGGKMGKVAAFMTGPWGAALLVAISLLGPFIGKLFESSDALGDMVDKMKADAEATENNRQAKLLYMATEEGVAQAIRDSTEATRQSIAAEKSAAEQSNIAAKMKLQEEIAIRRATQARYEDARAALGVQIQSARAPGERGDIAALGIASRQNEVDALAAKIAAQGDLIAQAEARVQETRIALAGEAAARAVDPMARIKKIYDDQVSAAHAKARAEGEVNSALTRQLTQIERNRQAAIKAEQDRAAAREKAAPRVSQAGRNISLADARDIVEGVGGHVNSDHRTRAEQEKLYAKYMAYKNGGPWAPLAARPGTSNHELDQAVDVAKARGVTLAKLVTAFRQAGVKVVEQLDEGSHYHIAWKKTGEAALAATQERKDQSEQIRKAAEAQRELAQDLSEVVRTFDPARAAAEDYAATLAKIDRLVKSGALTIEQASGYRLTAIAQDQERIAAARVEQFRTLFGTGDPMRGDIGRYDRDLKASNDNGADVAEAKLRAAGVALDELRGYGIDFAETVLSPDTWTSWGNAGQTIIGSLKSEFIKLALLNPLRNLINGDSALPTLTSAIGKIGGLFGGAPKVGANATGTEYWGGGLSLVGELGPEVVSMPRGSRVTPAADTRRMLAAGNDNGGRRLEVTVTPSPYFDVRVQEVAGPMADVAATRGAAGGSAMAQREIARGQSRAIV